MKVHSFGILIFRISVGLCGFGAISYGQPQAVLERETIVECVNTNPLIAHEIWASKTLTISYDGRQEKVYKKYYGGFSPNTRWYHSADLSLGAHLELTGQKSVSLVEGTTDSFYGKNCVFGGGRLTCESKRSRIEIKRGSIVVSGLGQAAGKAPRTYRLKTPFEYKEGDERETFVGVSPNAHEDGRVVVWVHSVHGEFIVYALEGQWAHFSDCKLSVGGEGR